MRILSALLLIMLATACGRPQPQNEATMSQQRPQRSPEALTIGRIQPRNTGVGIELSSDAFPDEGVIDLRHTAYGDNLSPPLHWTPVPGAGAYAIVIEDPDAPKEIPFVHWLIWNIPGETTSLSEGLPINPELVSPQGALQGRNDNGSTGYYGPHPPVGDSPHHYHFQIFALDGPLGLHAGADIRTLTDAMKGRVLADGELVATFTAPAH